MTAYLLTSSLLLTVFYAFFMLFMRKTTFFRFNRAAVLAGTLACMLLPLFDFGLPALPRHRPDFPEDMQITRFFQAFLLPETRAGAEAAGAGGWKSALAAVYGAGCIAVLVATSVSLARICLALSRIRGVRQGRYIIHAVGMSYGRGLAIWVGAESLLDEFAIDEIAENQQGQGDKKGYHRICCRLMPVYG